VLIQSQYGNSILGKIAEPTLQQPRCTLWDIFEHDLPPSVLDQTIDWRFFFIFLDGDANFHHPAGPLPKKIDGISRHILEQEPGSRGN
jgi:hypothetical protein